MQNTVTEKVFETFSERPNVAICMSGIGTNAQALLANSEIRNLYDIRCIVTDKSNSNARTIAQDNDLLYIEKNQGSLRSNDQRYAYFEAISEDLEELDIKAIFYAGFMKVATSTFCNKYPGVNVHPADLTIINNDGLARFRGMKALQEMRESEGIVKASFHIVDTPVDTGSVITVTDAIRPPRTMSDYEVHTKLKEKEHELYQKTLICLGRNSLNIADIPFDLQRLNEACNE